MTHEIEKADEGRQREAILQRLQSWLEPLMVLLGFAWLILLIVEFTRGLTPFLERITVAIWVIFVLDFVAQFAVAPNKRRYLRDEWITAFSLLIPALRILRFLRAWRMLRAVRAARGLRLIRLLTRLNRGMKALGASLGRRGFGYVLALTLLVTVSGAGGIYALEDGLSSYGEALWWTAMLLTSIGSEYWPETGEGRLLCVLLSVYGFAVFGYITATLASFFIGRDVEKQGPASARAVGELKQELQALRQALVSRNE